MGVGDDIPVGGHDDAGADGGPLRLLGHHGDHGGVHLGIYLLGRQGLALGVPAGQAHAGVSLNPGNAGGLAAENVHNAAGVVAVAVGQGPMLAAAAAAAQYGRQHHSRHRHRQHGQGDPQPQTAAALLLFGGLLPDVLGHGVPLDIVADHLPALGLLGNVPGDYLLRFLRGRFRGLRQVRIFRSFRADILVFVCHSKSSSHVLRMGWASCTVKLKEVTPFSLVTVIFSLCWDRMVFTTYRPSP